MANGGQSICSPSLSACALMLVTALDIARQTFDSENAPHATAACICSSAATPLLVNGIVRLMLPLAARTSNVRATRCQSVSGLMRRTSSDGDPCAG
jgi:hypothetical protein